MAELATIGKVKALVSESVFKRAQEIEASDKLREVVFVEEEALLTTRAECIGSSPTDVYVLKVTIDGTAATGECSCPAGQNAKFGLCKHVVAVLLRRVKEAQRRRNAPCTSNADEEVVIRICSQTDDVAVSEVAESKLSSLPRNRVAPASALSSKRSLPAWMLGVAGSAGEADSSQKSKKRPSASNPPRPAPVVRKRPRVGQPLQISDIDDRAEDPGEVEDANPVKEGLGVGVVQNETSKPAALSSAGALARERRRVKEQKKEDDFSVGGHGDEDRGGVTRSAAKRTGTKPAGTSKRRRLKKKYVAEESDLSEDELSPNVPGDPDQDIRLTDDDLMLLAQEQLQGQSAAQEIDDGKRDAGEGSSKLEHVAGNHRPARKHKSSSIFSMDSWRDTSPPGPHEGPGRDLRGDPPDLDMEMLKNFSVEAGSQVPSQQVNDLEMETLKNLGVEVGSQVPSQLIIASTGAADELLEERSTGSKLERLPIISAVDESDAIANDMFSLMFGGNMGSTGAARAPDPSKSLLPDDTRTSFTALATTGRSSSSVEKLDDHPAVAVERGREVGNVDVQFGTKKKSSLKDKVKMLLD